MCGLGRSRSRRLFRDSVDGAHNAGEGQVPSWEICVSGLKEVIGRRLNSSDRGHCLAGIVQHLLFSAGACSGYGDHGVHVKFFRTHVHLRASNVESGSYERNTVWARNAPSSFSRNSQTDWSDLQSYCKYCTFLSKHMPYPQNKVPMADDTLEAYVR